MCLISHLLFSYLFCVVILLVLRHSIQAFLPGYHVHFIYWKLHMSAALTLQSLVSSFLPYLITTSPHHRIHLSTSYAPCALLIKIKQRNPFEEQHNFLHLLHSIFTFLHIISPLEQLRILILIFIPKV